MKNITKFLLLTAAMFPCTQLTAADKYVLDPDHSYVEWHINHFGFSNPSGKWMANGTIMFDKDNVQNSHVDVTINVGNIITGNPELDKHLKSSLFFDTDKFPTATFVSDKIEVTNKEVSKLHGILTVHGTSKPITLDVKTNKIGKNPITDLETLGFSASTKIKRSDFGVNGFIPQISDDVKLDIEVEANQPKAQEKK